MMVMLREQNRGALFVYKNRKDQAPRKEGSLALTQNETRRIVLQ